MARPSKYSDELVTEICERIADGESLRSICREEGMPTRETIRCWLNDKSEFSAQYARAKVMGADAFEEQILEEAQKTDAKNAQAVKVKTDILFRLMAQRNPKKYAERRVVDANVTNIKRPEQMTDEELRKFIGDSENS